MKHFWKSKNVNFFYDQDNLHQDVIKFKVYTETRLAAHQQLIHNIYQFAWNIFLKLIIPWEDFIFKKVKNGNDSNT